MKRSAFLLALCLVASAAQAEDGLTLGIGADYSSGDYGTDTTTTIFSVPVTAKYTSGSWTWKASLPWMRVDGDPNVVPGLGSITNTNPDGRGRGGLLDPAQPESGTASGIGDLRLSGTYSVDTGSALGMDLTANLKLATADEDKGLGTGANDYGVAIDLYRDFDGTLLFGGAGYTILGDSDYIDVDSVINANIGAAWKVGSANVGAMYDYRQPTNEQSDDRSEVTGFMAFPTSASSKMQVYVVKGLTDGSPDWGVGASLSAGF